MENNIAPLDNDTITRTTVRNWRAGKRPLLEHAHAVAAYFGKTVDEMMR